MPAFGLRVEREDDEDLDVDDLGDEISGLVLKFEPEMSTGGGVCLVNASMNNPNDLGKIDKLLYYAKRLMSADTTDSTPAELRDLRAYLGEYGFAWSNNRTLNTRQRRKIRLDRMNEGLQTRDYIVRLFRDSNDWKNRQAHSMVPYRLTLKTYDTEYKHLANDLDRNKKRRYYGISIGVGEEAFNYDNAFDAWFVQDEDGNENPIGTLIMEERLNLTQGWFQDVWQNKWYDVGSRIYSQLFDDEEIIEWGLVVQQRPDCYTYASESLKRNPRIVAQAVACGSYEASLRLLTSFFVSLGHEHYVWYEVEQPIDEQPRGAHPIWWPPGRTAMENLREQLVAIPVVRFAIAALNTLKPYFTTANNLDDLPQPAPVENFSNEQLQEMVQTAINIAVKFGDDPQHKDICELAEELVAYLYHPTNAVLGRQAYVRAMQGINPEGGFPGAAIDEDPNYTPYAEDEDEDYLQRHGGDPTNTGRD
jgi:hypothetical protein